jgi:hypothetical protein
MREMLFANDAAFAAHTETALQCLITLFEEACTEFGLTISLRKTNIMAHDISTTLTIAIRDHTLEDKFTYLGSTICNNLSLDAALNVRIGKAATAMACLAKRVWVNSILTINTQMKVSTLLYGSKAWTLYTHQERRLNAFHLHHLRRFLGITWQDRVSNADVLAGQVCQTSSPPFLRNVCALARARMHDGRWPHPKGHPLWRACHRKLATGTWPTGRPDCATIMSVRWI